MANVWNVVLRGTILGAEFQTSRFYAASDELATPDATFLNTLGAALQGAYTGATSGLTLDSLHVRKAGPGQIGFDFVPSAFPYEGENEADPAPGWLAARIDWRGAQLINPHQGYTRSPGLIETHVSGNFLTASGILFAGAVRTAWITPRAGGGGVTWTPWLWSDTYNAGQAIGTGTIASKVASQGSRKPGAGS